MGEIRIIHQPMELKPGVCLVMGNGEFPLWRVLEVDREKGNVLLLAERIVRNYYFLDHYDKAHWKDSSVRAWLNGEFLKNNFSLEEQSAILEEEVYTAKAIDKEQDKQVITKDRLFLLNAEEAKKYLDSEASRSEGEYWWLRDTGIVEKHAVIVFPDGSIDEPGFFVSGKFGIRPALRMDLDSAFFRSLAVSGKEGKVFVSGVSMVMDEKKLLFLDHNCEKAVLPEGIRKVGKRAVSDCPQLESLDWHTPHLKFLKEAVRECPKLKMPAWWYCSGEADVQDFMQYLPDDAETVRTVLQKAEGDEKAWAYHAVRVITPATLEKLLELEEKERNNCLFLLAAGPYAYDFGQSLNDDDEKTRERVWNRYPMADLAASNMDHVDLMNRISRNWGQNQSWIGPLVRYANEEESAFLTLPKATGDEGYYLKVRSAMVYLNETVAAMMVLDAAQELERYAAIRHEDADELRQRIMERLDLNEKGEKEVTVKGTGYVLKLDENGQTHIYDRYGNKTLEPVYEFEKRRKEDLQLIHAYYDLQTVWQSVRKQLINGFFSRKGKKAESFSRLFGKQPVYRDLAERVVFEQDGTYFTLRYGIPCDHEGRKTETGDGMVQVAYPGEMDPESIERWMAYFEKKGIMPLFDQLNEPLLDPSLVTPQRYGGFEISWRDLEGKEDDGIRVSRRSVLYLKDFRNTIMYFKTDGSMDLYFEYERFTPLVNHIGAILEKLTLEQRMLKDDVSFLPVLSLYSNEEVRQLLEKAMENKCVKVTTALVDLLHQRMKKRDPVKELEA